MLRLNALYRVYRFKSYKALIELKNMDCQNDSQKTALSKLDDLMQIAKAIKKASNHLPNTEISK